jgi:hypothetical protein
MSEPKLIDEKFRGMTDERRAKLAKVLREGRGTMRLTTESGVQFQWNVDVCRETAGRLEVIVNEGYEEHGPYLVNPEDVEPLEWHEATPASPETGPEVHPGPAKGCCKEED